MGKVTDMSTFADVVVEVVDEQEVFPPICLTTQTILEIILIVRMIRAGKPVVQVRHKTNRKHIRW